MYYQSNVTRSITTLEHKMHTASLMILLTTELGRFRSSGLSAMSTPSIYACRKWNAISHHSQAM